MKKNQLKIETHTQNKNSGLKLFKTNKTTNLQNVKSLKKIFKAKLEDRNRIKGISFSNFKTENNNLFLYKIKKKEEAVAFELGEANYLRSLRDYNQLKHEIYLKELKEKKVKTKEAKLNEKIIKKDINYTFLKETLYQFMRFKKSHNKYNTNLLKNKDELKRAGKMAKSNFINKTVKSVTQRFQSITGKIDMGNSRREEILHEKEYDHLIEQISKSRKKHLKSFQAINNNNNINIDTSHMKIYTPKQYRNLTYNKYPFISPFQDNNQEFPNDENRDNDNDDEFILNLKNQYKNKTARQMQIKNITDSNINQIIIKYKKRQSESGKKISRNINYISSKNESKRPKSTKYKTHILSNPVQINNLMNKGYIKTCISDIKEIENDSKYSISSNSNQEYIKQENKNIKEFDELNKNSLINLERLKKYNILKEKRNPKYWNNNVKRLNTAGNRTNKIINKPLYVSKISDFIKEYKRIKSVSKSTRKRMREKHFTTLDNIEKISKTKEELLMFILKMKFLQCRFPQKIVKTISKKELFLKRFNNYLNIIDNPYSLATKELKAELMKYENL